MMRGQEYTVMNYFVWAVFAAAFALVVFAAYHSVASQGCRVSDDQLRQLLRDAGKMHHGCVQSRTPIMLCGGTVITREFVQSQVGFEGNVCFCVGRGATVTEDAVEVRSTMRASVRVCRRGDKVYLCINNPFACETGKNCECK